jgi:hypothetical protein
MIVTFYLEIENGERYTFVNHTVTKPEEIEWLLKQVKQKLEEAQALSSVPPKLSCDVKEELGQKIKKRF